MSIIRFRGPAVTPQQHEQQYPASFTVLARLHGEAAAARESAKDAIACNDVDALALAVRQLADAEAQARTLTDVLEAIHWQAVTLAEAAEAAAALPMTDEEADALMEQQANADAARRGPYR